MAQLSMHSVEKIINVILELFIFVKPTYSEQEIVVTASARCIVHAWVYGYVCLFEYVLVMFMDFKIIWQLFFLRSRSAI